MVACIVLIASVLVRGLYAAWRRLAESDLAWSFAGLSGWRAALARWPEQPLDAIVAELRCLGLPESRWEAYLTRLALELPGWSGMMNWRQQHGAYPANRETPVALADYLALRLCLDGLWIEHLCRACGSAVRVTGAPSSEDTHGTPATVSTRTRRKRSSACFWDG